MGRRCQDLAEQVWPGNLQEVQDGLSTSAGIPVLFAHASGRPLAVCEDLSLFCRHFTRAVALTRPCLGCGRAAQEVHDDGAGNLPLRLSPPVHICPLGLMDVAIPIESAGQTIGHILAAQVLPGSGGEQTGEGGELASTDGWADFSESLSRRSRGELERVSLLLSVVAGLTGELAAARRRNLRLADHVRDQRRWLQRHVTTDRVTGLANHRQFRAALEQEVLRARRYQRSLSVAVLDVEGFRKINDEFGHDLGDEVLRGVAECLSGTVRQTDLVARVGGDEFGIIFPETTRAEAMIALTRVMHEIGELNAKGELPVEIRVSVGVAEDAPGAEDPLEAAAKAEQAVRGATGMIGCS